VLTYNIATSLITNNRLH